ncbi:ROK family protein [Paenibacillus aceti]|uniref:Glucokinase n=1 Tax=Paenibacillus aceti TaxID=1820010 RepID=A0ABQ1VQH8_9BACL|nr:ROK family protein [Paenibacillus aceti]GGF85632.1 glucokinase [Paenibacillus aceti]
MNIIGIDIGGTSIKGLVINERGEELHEAGAPTEASRGKDHIILQMEKVVRQLLDRYPDAAGIGIGTAGRVDVDTGRIVYATDNLPGWQGFELRQWCEARFNLPVIADNDANTALAGEAWLGAGVGLADLTMLTLGTGVGGANMIGGKLYRGAHWNGGEWGHVVFVPHGHPCNCGMQGCIEQYVSGTALVRLAREAAQQDYASGREVFAAYEQGNAAVAAVIRRFVDDLALFIHNIHIGLNPRAMILGGGVVEAKALWWDMLEQRLAALDPALDVRAASLGNRAGAIGGARLVLDELLE